MKFFRLSAIILLLINGVAAIAGGFELIGDPSGTSMGWTTAMLEYTPFDDYLIPGVLLFIANGLFSLFIAFLTIKKKKHYTLYIVLQGAILCVWIISQIRMIRFYHPLHLFYFAIGLLLIVCGYILSAITPSGIEKSRNLRMP